ncbi:hypothetical protein GGR50DRAFT_692169 [Xylaria sp. CBS 124048]|nr:hypothetical protein GGR50DRAFT_692169 [Xylaria sp. CBS 124048]
MGSKSDVSSSENGRDDEGCQRLAIIVLRGDPIDAPQYRHTALFIEHLNGSGRITQNRLMQAVGSTGMFERDEATDRDPMESEVFAGRVTVATIPVVSSSDTRLRDTIWSTPVNNMEYDWNCQHWVGDALSACAWAGLISTEEADEAIDGMTDLILQGQDSAA